MNLSLPLMTAFFLITISLFAADDEPVTVTADIARYDGSTVVLSGNITVDHQERHVTADHALMLREVDQDRLSFQRIKLQGNVHFSDAESRRLTCSFADINYRSLNSHFSSTDFTERVYYHDVLETADHRHVPLEIQSQNMHIKMGKGEEKGDDTPLYYLKTLVADNFVSIRYDDDLLILAQEAIYDLPFSQEQNIIHSSEHFPGTITLRPATKETACRILRNNGDHLEAQQILLDRTLDRFTLDEPRGKLAIQSSQTTAIDFLTFKAKSLQWEPQQHTITLYDDVDFSVPEFGELYVSEKVLLKQKEHAGALTWATAHCQGPLHWTAQKQNATYTIECFGEGFIDRLSLQATLTSPEKTAADQQICYHDENGKVYANHMVMHYEIDHKQVEAKRISLSGNVRMLYHAPDDETSLQYALADRVEYDLDSETLLLISEENPRVYYLDEGNHLQVSAPQVRIRKDPLRGTLVLKGEGNVKARFNHEEVERIKLKFS